MGENSGFSYSIDSESLKGEKLSFELISGIFNENSFIQLKFSYFYFNCNIEL